MPIHDINMNPISALLLNLAVIAVSTRQADRYVDICPVIFSMLALTRGIGYSAPPMGAGREVPEAVGHQDVKTDGQLFYVVRPLESKRLSETTPALQGIANQANVAFRCLAACRTHGASEEARGGRNPTGSAPRTPTRHPSPTQGLTRGGRARTRGTRTEHRSGSRPWPVVSRPKRAPNSRPTRRRMPDTPSGSAMAGRDFVVNTSSI